MKTAPSPSHWDPRQLTSHNQFLLGPSSYVERFDYWQRTQITDQLFLTTHPDLSVTQTTREAKSLTLLGFILDPHSPASTDNDILQCLMEQFSDMETFYKNTCGYGGRWILIVVDGPDVMLLTDAAGHRQVFYTSNGTPRDRWCASQPRILAEIRQLHISKEALSFIDSYEFRKNPEFRWPGERSPYDGIKHLLPNHSLNLKTGVAHRYWPDGPIPSILMEDAVRSVSLQLTGMMKAAASRFDLALSLTAGLDSRTMLAAARDASHSSPIMTVRQIDKPDDHADVQVAAQLTSRLGLHHDIIESSLVVEDDFLQAFKQNTALPHYVYIPDAHAILKLYHQKRVASTGSISEIGRLSFRSLLGKPETETITPQDLAKLQKMGRHPYALAAFHDWLSDLGDIHNVPLLDIFEWEQGHGNWLAMCHMEFDIAWRDIFSPYNCRNLLTTLLGVDPRYRNGASCELYQRIIHRLWPELLEVPINPHAVSHKTLLEMVKASIPYSIKKRLKKAIRYGQG